MCEVCKHLPSTAGEAVTMLKKAVPEIVIEWDPHSAADKLCYNFGMPLGVFLLVRVLSSFNTLLTSKTQPTPTRPLSTSYVRSYFRWTSRKGTGIPILILSVFV